MGEKVVDRMVETQLESQLPLGLGQRKLLRFPFYLTKVVSNVAKTLSFLNKMRVSGAPHYTANIPLKGDIHINPTRRERQSLMSFLSHDLSYIR